MQIVIYPWIWANKNQTTKQEVVFWNEINMLSRLSLQNIAVLFSIVFSNQPSSGQEYNHDEVS